MKSKPLREFTCYFYFFIISIIVFFYRHPCYMSEMLPEVQKLYMTWDLRRGDVNITFWEITTAEDVWEFLLGPVIALNTAISDRAIPFEYPHFKNNSQLHFGSETKVVLPLRIRQVRVSKENCTVSSIVAEYIKDCYPAYGEDTEDKKPFGLGKAPQWTYTDEIKMNASRYNGIAESYGGGGYYHDIIHPCENVELGNLRTLRDANWLDRGTRAVFVDVIYYNFNLNLFMFVKFIFEHTTFGAVIPSWNKRIAYLFSFDTKADYAILGLECSFAVGVVLYTIAEIKTIWNKMIGTSSSSTVLILLNIIIYTLSYTVIYLNFHIQTHLYSLRRISIKHTSNNDDASEMNIDNVKYFCELSKRLTATLMFFIIFKLFKYLSSSRIMEAVTKCAYEVLSFVIMLIVVFCGYAFAGSIIFGHMMEKILEKYFTLHNQLKRLIDPKEEMRFPFQLRIQIFNVFLLMQQFISFESAVFTLLRTTFGDFEFEELLILEPVVGSLYIFTFMFIIYFVLLNMFLAILVDTYIEIEDDVNEESKDDDAFSEETKQMAKQWLRPEPSCRCLRDIKRLDQRLEDIEKELDALSYGLDNIVFKVETLAAFEDAA